MSHTEVREFLRSQPFVPFRIEVADGTAYEIRHPDRVIPTYTALHIGIPAAKDPDGYERVVVLSLAHVRLLVPLAAAEPSLGK